MRTHDQVIENMLACVEHHIFHRKLTSITHPDANVRQEGRITAADARVLLTKLQGIAKQREEIHEQPR